MYPYRSFGDNEPESERNIIVCANSGPDTVYFTRNGGMFMRPPADLLDPDLIASRTPEKDFEHRAAFLDKASNLFNRIICEFCLLGIVSEPATPTTIAAAMIDDGAAWITSAGGARESYLERTIVGSVPRDFISGLIPPSKHPTAQAGLACNQEHASRLAEISEHLPTLVAGAYYQFSRRQLSEALVDSWIVIEQIIDCYWTYYVSHFRGSRKDRLVDARTYTVAVRLETLHTVDLIPYEIYEYLNIARKHRNELAHRALIDINRAADTVLAMHALLEFCCNSQLAMPLARLTITW